MKGFFSPTIWTKQNEPEALEPLCGACGLWQHCRSPKMKPTGLGRRRVLIYAEGPGENEDEKGYQLCGNAGFELVRLLHRIGINMRKDCWLDNAIRCRATDEHGDNRTPTRLELEYCRPNLAKTLNLLKPDVIIPMGGPAIESVISLAWKKNQVKDVGAWADPGWQIPSVKLNAWICPLYHPSYLLHSKEPVVELIMQRHLRAAFSLDSKPWEEKPDWESRVLVEMDPIKAAARIRELMAGDLPLAFDFETNMLKPHSKRAEIICCSVSDGITSVAYPWAGEAIVATRELIRSTIPKIVSNLKFEEAWCRAKLGIAVNNWQHDTVLGAHWLNCQHGICSVKFQSFVLLGAEDYSSHLDPYMAGPDSNSPNRLREVEPAELYKYCALDALFEVLVAQEQRRKGGLE